MRDKEDIAEFVGRDWKAADLAKELYWCEWKRRHGPAGGIRMADELRRQVALTRPNWPSAKERREDHAAHLRLIEVLRLVPPRRR